MLRIWVLSLFLLGAVHGNEVCYERLGCFNDNIPWAGTTERPIAKLPWSPERINTRFLLYTNENPNNFQEISAVNSITISYSNFNTTRKTRFIIHGYIDQGEENWLSDMCKRMFQLENLNCICVDWSSGSKTLFTQSAANIRVVGAEMAYFINTLKDEYGYAPSNVHFIGHSMGAHAAGETGRRVKGIARITALDPAEPYFQGTPIDVRLDTTDASFVDVIHSDAGPMVPNLGLGMSQSIGHLDFFPNGGVQMPGCKKNIISQIVDIDGIWEGTRDFVACNHLRSYKYYSDSILSKEGFVGYPSPTYESFNAGTGFPCPSTGCPLMGHFADDYKRVTSVSQKFYLNTGDAKDFARYRYNVSVTLTGASSVSGYFNVALYGSKGNTRQYQIFKGKMKSGKAYSAFIDVEHDVGALTKIKFLWNNNILNPFLPKLGGHTAEVQNGRDAVRSKFCGSETVRENVLQSLSPC